MRFVTQQQDDLTDLWVQRLKNMFNWNIRDSLKPIMKKQAKDSPEVAGVNLGKMDISKKE